MNYYQKSKKEFKKKVKENRKLSKIDWDEYVQDNGLFSANTLMFHVDANSFEDLKAKLS